MENDDYKVNHTTYTSAIEEVESFANKNGYFLNKDEMFDKVGINSIRPKEGDTNRISLHLYEMNGETLVFVDKEMIHFQVYGRENSFELNMYIL